MVNTHISAYYNTHFYNKILFCDIVGFSRRDSIGQFRWQGRLTESVDRALRRVDAKLSSDVFALSTGDGVALNFLMDKPDVHVRAALHLLEDLHSDEETLSRIPLRIGLNSFVDTLVPDINGMCTVIGDGINIAQRVMDLAGAGQILMHDRVRVDLASYEAYQKTLVVCGEYPVKHGVRLPIVQFVDPALAFISNQPLAPSRDGPIESLSLDQILARRVTENVLTLSISGSDLDFLPEVADYVESYLESNIAFRSRRFAVAWLVLELAGNSLRHGSLDINDKAMVKIVQTINGLQVTVDQPDHVGFSLAGAIADPANADSFLQIMSRAGLRPRARRVGERLEISIEIPNTFEIGPNATVQHLSTGDRGLSNVPSIPNGVPGPARDKELGMPGSGSVEFIVLDVEGRIDETTWESFSDSILQAVQRCVADNCDLIIDLGKVDYMSSRGLRALSLGKRAAEQVGVGVAIANLNEAMSAIFAISRYDKLFRVYPHVPTRHGASR